MTDDDRRPPVLLTGGAGGVASRIRPYLRATYRLRLIDQRSPEGAAVPGEEIVGGDLLSGDVAAAAMRGVHALVHLAGNASPGADWAHLRPANVDLAQHLLETAVRTGVERVVLASSVHATGRYVREHRFPIDPSWAPAPCCLYGASKVAVEALGSAYSLRHDLPVVCLRIGAAIERPHTAWALRTWSSPRDLAHIIDRSIVAAPRSGAAATTPRFGIYYAVSANSRGIYLTANARDDLGYRPVDDAERYATEATGEDGPPCFGPCPV